MGWPLMVKVKMDKLTELQGALAASLIIHKRPIHLQTAGTLTSSSLNAQTLPFFVSLSVHTYVSHVFRCVWPLPFCSSK